VDEACTQVGVHSSAYARPNVPSDLPQDVRQYLSRPIVFQRGVYSNTTYGQVSTGDISDATVASYFPTLSRLTGSYGWRATIVLRLEIQATPYQSGLLRLGWCPEYRAVAATTYNPFAYLTTFSQLPGVVLDINESTSVILRVPFVSSLDYWFLNHGSTTVNQKFDIGTWAIWALTPVSSPTGALPPNWALWTSIEDVEVIAMAPNNASVTFTTPGPQVVVGDVEPSPPHSQAEPGLLESLPLRLLSRSNSFRRTVTPQMATGEERAAPTGPISGALALASRVALFAGMAVPMISSYANPAAWMLRAGSMLASAFGWSKPINTAAVNRVFNTANNYQQNCDAFDTSWNLGLFSDNQVTALSGFAGTDVDEMAIDYIISVPAIINTFNFASTNAVGDVLCNIAISPLAMYYQLGTNGLISFGVDAAFTSFLPAPVMYIANCFRYWAGDFKFKFRMAKTKFHSGRLIVAHIPFYADGNTTVLAAPVTGTPMNFKSHIWDLKDSNDYEFIVPYTCYRPFARVTDILGSLSITVEQPLMAPSTVVPTIPIIVEVQAMPGFVFGAPMSPNYLPSPIIPKTVVPQDGLNKTHYVMGEDIKSVKQLAMRLAMTLQSAYGPIHYWFSPTYQPNITTPTSVSYTTVGFSGYFKPLYAYSRGSSRYSVLNMNKNQRLAVVLNVDGSYDNPSAASQVVELGNPLHFIVPPYNITNRMRNTSTDPTAGTLTYAQIRPVPVANTTIATTSWADDTQFGYFLSTFPLQRRNNAITNTNVDTAWTAAVSSVVS
jgi:hypothetical protein